MIAMAMAALIAAGAQAAPAQANTVKQERVEVVCTTRKKANSRFLKRNCLTRSKYEAQSADQARQAAEQINRPSINPASNGG